MTPSPLSAARVSSVRTNRRGSKNSAGDGHTSGAYQLRLRPAVDGITWFNDEGVLINMIVRRYKAR